MTAAVVFDFDGTIVDTEEPLYLSWAELYAEHGHDLDRGFWQTLIGTDDGFDPWADLEARVGAPLDAGLADRRRARRDALIHEREVEGGILAWLEAADRLGMPVAVASSSSEDWVHGHLVRLGLRERFAVLACRSHVIPPKPDPTSFRHACEQLGADAAHSLAVEDSPHGVAAARAAGLFTIAVPGRLTTDLDYSAADVVVGSLADLTLDEALVLAAQRRRATS